MDCHFELKSPSWASFSMLFQWIAIATKWEVLSCTRRLGRYACFFFCEGQKHEEWTNGQTHIGNSAYWRHKGCTFREKGVAPARDPGICATLEYAVPLPPKPDIWSNVIWRRERHRIKSDLAYCGATGRCHPFFQGGNSTVLPPLWGVELSVTVFYLFVFCPVVLFPCFSSPQNFWWD